MVRDTTPNMQAVRTMPWPYLSLIFGSVVPRSKAKRDVFPQVYYPSTIPKLICGGTRLPACTHPSHPLWTSCWEALQQVAVQCTSCPGLSSPRWMLGIAGRGARNTLGSQLQGVESSPRPAAGAVCRLWWEEPGFVRQDEGQVIGTFLFMPVTHVSFLNQLKFSK